MGKQIPLVMYKKGVRHVLGMASVEDDGSIVAQVAKDKWVESKHLFVPGIGELSINPSIVNVPPN
jgi:hypothetical protein